MKLVRILRGSLMVRVAFLAFVSGLLVLLALVFTVGALSAAPTNLKQALVLIVIIALPLMLGWLTLRLVMGPLHHLANAIAILRSGNAETPIVPSGISEFDTILISFHEVTTQLSQEEELRKNLISDTSHELNTPLTAMTSQLVAMQEGKLPITKQRIDLLSEQAERLVTLTKGLDAYSRARLPQHTKTEDILVKKICQQLIDELSSRLHEESMHVSLDIPDSLIVRADRQAFQQILHNWLENVLRYSGAAQAQITADEHGITLSDNGRGVPDKDLSHLFERFYRVEKSRNRSTGGLGLGLAIVQELVERQGWAIRVEAAHPGLAFVITFAA